MSKRRVERIVVLITITVIAAIITFTLASSIAAQISTLKELAEERALMYEQLQQLQTTVDEMKGGK